MIYLYIERQKKNDNKAREMKRFRETSTRVSLIIT